MGRSLEDAARPTVYSGANHKHVYRKMAHLLPAAPATQPWESYLQSQLPVILLIYVEQRARTPRGICSELDVPS